MVREMGLVGAPYPYWDSNPYEMCIMVSAYIKTMQNIKDVNLQNLPLRRRTRYPITP